MAEVRLLCIHKFLSLQLCKCKILHSSLTKCLLCAQSQAFISSVSIRRLTLIMCSRTRDLNLWHSFQKAINVYLFPLTCPDCQVQFQAPLKSQSKNILQCTILKKGSPPQKSKLSLAIAVLSQSALPKEKAVRLSNE